MDQLLVGRHEAAAALGISLRSLDYNIARGELAVRRIGRRVLIERRELERFARSGSRAKTTARSDAIV